MSTSTSPRGTSTRVDAAAPVGGRVTEGGAGPVDLVGQDRHRLVAVGGGARAQCAGVAERAYARVGEPGQLCPLALADDGRQRHVIGRGCPSAAATGRRSTPPATRVAVRWSSAASVARLVTP